MADTGQVQPTHRWLRRFLFVVIAAVAALALSGAVSGAVALYLPQHPVDPSPAVRFQVGR